jgi:hypothetical protein
MVKRTLAALFLVTSLAGCTAPQPVSSAAPGGWPVYLRWDLVPRWIAWNPPKPDITWPPHDGCAADAIAETLTPGMLIDRFGRDGGSFFSPKGESYAGRAVPYVCRQMDYTIYKVAKPMPVSACKAAPWFGEPGGAIQYGTVSAARDLVAAGQLEIISHAVPGSAGPAPQCGDP